MQVEGIVGVFGSFEVDVVANSWNEVLSLTFES
jgi:hypothetical protein